MVEFKEDNNSQTSGDGKFLIDIEPNLNYIDYPNKMRCDTGTNLVIDLPPHNTRYFELQLEAVRNYYLSVSDNNIDIAYGMIENSSSTSPYYQLSNEMSYYATSDQQIGLLFADGVQMAYDNADIDDYLNNNSLSIEDVLFVVFHAGLGQEASQPFDPTIYDIKSAYVDSDMLQDISNQDYWIAQEEINRGLIMPETLNWIFYDVVEDIFSLSFTPEDELENLLCGQQLGMTGLFAHLLGYHFQFPLMTNHENGRYGIGDFGLMDQGCFNQQGIIPAKPNPWTRTNSQISQSWQQADNQTENLFSGSEDCANGVDDDGDGDVDCDDSNCYNSAYAHPDCNINAENTYALELSIEANDEVYRFDIEENEYYLIENRYGNIEVDNGVYSNQSLHCIIDYYRDYPSYCELDPSLDSDGDSDYIQANDKYKHIFDIINDPLYGRKYNDTNNIDNNEDIFPFEIHDGYNVITKVKNYDYGLPGSGILIWHIKEPNYSDYMTGINNDENNRAVVLEEGDGVQQIGGPDYDWFPGIDYTQGREFDFWYDSNIQYESMNYPNEEDIIKRILFDNNSIPNTKTYDNINSYLSFEITSIRSEIMTLIAKLDYSDYYKIDYIKENTIVIGHSIDEDCIYYIDENQNIFKRCINQNNEVVENSINNTNYDTYNIEIIDVTFDSIDDNARILTKDNLTYIVPNSNYYIDKSTSLVLSMDDNPIYPIGYYSDLNNTEQVPDALSLGDIDLDGYDEMLSIDGNNTLHCYNYNDTYCPGFPVYGLFREIPLIVDLIDDSNGPEIILKNGSYISIISNNGIELLSLPLYNDSEIKIIPNWKDDNTACLVNGNRLFIFENFNEDNSYWYNYYSTSYNYPEVSIPGPRDNIAVDNISGIDLNRTYNYPNPIEDGHTKFRFFVHNANKVFIKIYDSLGFLVDRLESSLLDKNEYNEISWNASTVDSGLYFAEVSSDFNESKLIKVVVIK